MRKLIVAILVGLGLVVPAQAQPLTQESVKSNQEEKAIFAGGCFWCMTAPFDKLPGVNKVIAGYTGGPGAHPTYSDYGAKGHTEAVEITFDPDKITYQQLLDVYWRQVDPTDGGGQFCDRGFEYKPAIYFVNEQQQILAQQAKDVLQKSGRFQKPLAVEIIAATIFYPAEEYHQDYYRKNPLKYKFYRFNCGRDQRLEKVWGQSPSH